MVNDEAKRNLAQSNEFFRLLVSAVQDYAIFGLDPAGNVLTWNSGAQRLKGYSASEIVGRHFSAFYTPEDLARQLPQQELEIATRQGKYEEEGWRVRKDGSRYWASVSITALCDDQGRLQGFAKITRDLSEKMKAERAKTDEHRQTVILEQTQTNEKTLDQIFAQAPSFMTVLSVPDYRFLKSNEQHSSLMQRWDLIGKTITEVDPGLEGQGILQLLDSVVSTGVPFVAREMPITYLPGTPRARKVYLDFVYEPLRRTDGEIYAIVVQGHNVTEQVLSRKSVENERQNFRNLFKQTPEMVCILSGPKHRFEFVNEAHIKALGFDATGLEVRAAQPESVEVHGILDQVYESGETAFLREIPVTLTGRLRYFNLTYSARHDDAGKINGVMILGLEVTDTVVGRERLAELLEASRQSEEQMRLLADERRRVSERNLLLADASAVFSQSLNYEQTLQSLATVIVERMADWCSISLTEAGQTPREVAIAHPDAERLKLAQEMFRDYPTDWNAPTGAARVIRTGKSEVFFDLSDELLKRSARDARHLELIRGLKLSSVMIVPLVARGRVLGTISFIASESDRRYSTNDLQVAEEIGRRAGHGDRQRASLRSRTKSGSEPRRIHVHCIP